MVIKYEFYPLGFAHEICRQQDRLSLYQSRLASFLSQDMQDSKLEEYIRHKIDDATAHIHVLKIISTWEVSPRREGAVGTSDAAGIGQVMVFE